MRISAFIFILMFSSPNAVFAQQPSCDYKVEILVDGNEFEKEEFKWRMRATEVEGNSTNITATAEIEDSKGKTVKSYKPWTSDLISKQKTSGEYSPNLKEGEEYKITAEVNVECDDTNKDNNIDMKKIRIIEKITKEPQDEGKQLIPNAENTIKPKSGNTIDKEKTPMKETKPMTSSSIQNLEVAYLSSSEKAKGLIMIFLLTLSVLLNIVLIWKR